MSTAAFRGGGALVYALFALGFLVFAAVAWGLGMFLPRALLLLFLGWLYLQVGLLASLRPYTGRAGRGYVLRSLNHPLVYAALFAVFALAPLWTAFELLPRHTLVTLTVEDRNSFPVLLPGDRVYGPRSGWLHQRPERGELVVVQGEAPHPTVLRVVGVPGDEVALESGVPVVNGSPLFRERLGRVEAHGPLSVPAPASLEGLVAFRESNEERSYEIYVPQGVAADERPPLRLGPNEFYLLADLRGVEKVIDSRRLGPFQRGDITGRPVYVWWSADPDDGSPRFRRVGVRLR